MTAQKTSNGDRLYNELMKRIEPDLMTENLGKLAAKYAQESAEEKIKREKHYERAFQIFDEVLSDIGIAALRLAKQNKQKERKKALKSEQGERARALKNIERKLRNASS